MKLSQLGWAAGFLEGEGCFHTGSRICIRAAQVQPDPLYLLQSILGGQVNGPYERKNPKHQAFYDWNINGCHAIAAMMTMYPIMSPKRRESIRRAIAKWKVAPGNARLWVARGFCKNGHDLTGDNYVMYPSGHGQCRQCAREGRRRYWMKNKDKWLGYSRAARLRKKEGANHGES